MLIQPFNLFGGFYSNSGRYPVWIRWFQYLSPTRYALEALVRNEFEDRVLEEDIENPIDYLKFNIGF